MILNTTNSDWVSPYSFDDTTHIVMDPFKIIPAHRSGHLGVEDQMDIHCYECTCHGSVPFAGVSLRSTTCLIAVAPSYCRGFASLHHLPIRCRAFGAIWIILFVSFAGVSLCSTACLFAVAPSALFGFYYLFLLQGFRFASPPAYSLSRLRRYLDCFICSICRGFASLHRLPNRCRAFGAIWIILFVHFAGVPLRFTACLIAVAPSYCRGSASLHRLPNCCRAFGALLCEQFFDLFLVAQHGVEEGLDVELALLAAIISYHVHVAAR